MTAPLLNLVETLKAARSRGVGGLLFLGDGSATSVGIPGNSRLAHILAKEYPRTFEGVEDTNFYSLLGRLDEPQLDQIFDKYFVNTQISWSHIAAALLLKANYLDRIVTTNPHTMMIRAASLVGEFPRVYDGTATPLHSNLARAGKYIIYLLGQHLGAVPLENTKSRDTFLKSATNLIAETGKGRPWIAVGHATNHDPVVDILDNLADFENGLYWVHSGDSPSEEPAGPWVDGGKRCIPVGGFDPDSFMVSLARELGLFPPVFMLQPFTHLHEFRESIGPVPIYPGGTTLDVSDLMQQQTHMARDLFESSEAPHDLQGTSLQHLRNNLELQKALFSAQQSLLSGRPHEVLAQHDLYRKTHSPQLGELLYWAYIQQGEVVRTRILEAEEKDIAGLLEQAADQFEQACEIKPERSPGFYHWGRVLMEQASRETGETAERLRSRAGGKFQNVIKIDSQSHQGFTAWGNSLLERALTQNGEPRESLLQQSVEKYRAALGIDEESLEAASGIGQALTFLAEIRRDDSGIPLLEEAASHFQSADQNESLSYRSLLAWARALASLADTRPEEDAHAMRLTVHEKYLEAVRLEPDRHEAYLQWGAFLYSWASGSEDEWVEPLHRQAMEKFQSALKCNPQLPEAFQGLGDILANWGLRREGKQAAFYLKKASEMYRDALAVDPDNVKVFASWANTLLAQARQMPPVEAEPVYEQAEEKYEAILTREPEHAEALNNWGSIIMHLAQYRRGHENVMLSRAAEKFRAALSAKPDYAEALHNWGNVLFELAHLSEGKHERELFSQAEEKYQAALSLDPNQSETLARWGWLLLTRAKGEQGKEASPLLDQAEQNFLSSLDLKPDQPDTLLNLATTLMEKAKIRKGINAHPLLAQAKKILQQAADLRAGCASFHMARLMALLANESGSREWLEKCRAEGTLPDQATLMNEPDFATVRSSKWFKTLISEKPTPSLEPKESA